jgi:hypothetical protein
MDSLRILRASTKTLELSREGGVWLICGGFSLGSPSTSGSLAPGASASPQG